MWFILLTLAIVVITVLIRNKYTYWQRQGILSDRPNIPFGSIKETAVGKKAVSFVLQDIYNRYKERFVGIYLLFKPALLIRDVELARNILTQDFSSFHDRGTDTDISKDLFSLRGSSWKTLRAKLTPLFSTGTLKGMLPTVNDVGTRLLNHLDNQLAGKSSEVFDIKDVMTVYAIDIISSVFFGLDIDSYKDPKNEFRLLNIEFIKPSRFLDKVHALALFVCTPLARFMEFFGYMPISNQQVRAIMRRTINFREKHQIERRDFLQLLLQLRNSGKVNADENWSVQTAAEELKSMPIDMIADQCALFFIAGSETTSVTSAYTIYELSMYPEYMKKVVEEIESVLAKHNLKPNEPLPYEAVQDMKFLELCIMETLRKYPGLQFLNRECTKDFEMPNSDYTIKKGTALIISVNGLHYDPEHFPEPNKYDPYRFSEDQRNYNPNAYMPFGEGPHQCIAKRMGFLNAKIAVIKVLANFNVEPNKLEEIEFDYNSGVVLMAKGGLNVKLSKKVQ